MTTVSNVKTNTPVQPQQVSGSSASSSIYTDPRLKQQQSGEGTTTQSSNTNTSKIDDVINNVLKDAEIQKLGLSAQQIKESGILLKIAGVDEKQFEALDERTLKKVEESLKASLKDCVKNGQVDLEAAKKLGNQYYIALRTGWTIEGFKKQQAGIKQSTLIERLQDTGCLDKNKDYSDLSNQAIIDEVKQGIHKFFDKILLGNIIKNPKNAKEVKHNEQEYKKQLQTFGRILANSPDEQKALFMEVAKTLYADNRLEGFRSVLASCETQAQRTECAEYAANDPDFIKDVTTKGTYDSEGNLVDDKVMSQDDATAFNDLIFRNLDKDGADKAHKIQHSARKEWFEQNAEALKVLDAKLEEAKRNGVEPKLTDEEKQLLIERNNYIIAGQAGEMTGYANSSLLKPSEKRDILGTVNKDAYELPTYREVIEQVNKYVENHPEALTMPKEELVQLLDEATNGNYSKVVSGSNEPLNAPKEETTENETFVTPIQEQTERVVEQNVSQEQVKKASEKVKKINKQIAPDQAVPFTVLTSSSSVSAQKSQSSKFEAEEVAKLEKDAVKNGQIDKYLKATGKNMFEFASARVTDWHNTGKTTQEKIVAYAGRALCSTQVALGMLAANSEKCFRALAEEINFSNLSINLTHKQKEIVEEMA